VIAATSKPVGPCDGRLHRRTSTGQVFAFDVF
jgi:hypothetical protein